MARPLAYNVPAVDLDQIYVTPHPLQPERRVFSSELILSEIDATIGKSWAAASPAALVQRRPIGGQNSTRITQQPGNPSSFRAVRVSANGLAPTSPGATSCSTMSATSRSSTTMMSVR